MPLLPNSSSDLTNRLNNRMLYSSRIIQKQVISQFPQTLLEGLTEESDLIPLLQGNTNFTEAERAHILAKNWIPVPTSEVGQPGLTPGPGQVTVSWGPPYQAVNPVLFYTVTATAAGTSLTATAPGTDRSLVFTGLTNGVAYSFTIVATNSVGPSQPSNASIAIPVAVPDTVTGIVGSPRNTNIAVSWPAPFNGGTPITRYSTTAYSLGAVVATLTSLSPIVTFINLTNGTLYTFVVTAFNKVGASAPSAPSAPVAPATYPGKPTAILTTPGAGQVALSWTAPSSGGSAITHYIVNYGIGILLSPFTTATVTGLTAGTLYTFTITAVNGVGNSAPSAPVTATPT